jgi:ParB/RepB/Spo0J family partition protein
MAKVKKNTGVAIVNAVKSNMPDGEHIILTMDIMKTIVVDRENNRKRGMDDASIAKFASQLKAEGKIYQNISVEKLADGSMKVIAGHRRLLAAQVAGIPCPAMVYPQISDQQRKLVNVIENEQSMNPSVIDRAHAIKALKDLGITQTVIAEILDKQTTEISRDLSLLKLDKGLQDKIHEGLLSAEQGLALVKESEELQANLARKLEEDTAAADAAGMTDAQIKRQNTNTARTALANNKPPVVATTPPAPDAPAPATATTPVAQSTTPPAPATTPVAPATTPVATNLFKITGSTPVIATFPEVKPAPAVATKPPAVATKPPAVATKPPAQDTAPVADTKEDPAEAAAKRAADKKLIQLSRLWNLLFCIEAENEGKPIAALMTNMIEYAEHGILNKDVLLLQARTLGE